MSSLLVISNKALRKLGVKEISSLTQQGKAADRCNCAVVNVVQEVLREHSWGFASVWESLPRCLEKPPFGYRFAYQLPLNAVRIIDIRLQEDLEAPLINFELVRGNRVFTDAHPCYARYVTYDVADLRQAPTDFIDACAWKLAEEIAAPLAKASMMPAMHQQYLYVVDRARLNDSATKRERTQDENRVCSILASRGYADADFSRGDR